MSGKRLLFVDDDASVRGGLASTFRGLATCDTASTVAEAITALASHAHDAVVLDLVLDTDSEPLLDALSARGVPVLLLSGKDHEQLRQTASMRGWTWLAKPASPTVLLREVCALLGLDDVPEQTARHRRADVVPQAPEAKPEKPAASGVPVAVQVLDKLVDLAAVAALCALAMGGKLSGELAAAAIITVAGVSQGARALTGRSIGAGTAVAALAALLAADPTQALAAPPPTHHPRAHHARTEVL